ncbi:S-layer homology domain-containing protein [Paenibacillus turpanensis]|uniref:S-layer homology domain-containing protein n=1 Tax=Paenibacillus turpanensis TaxID=2689078 RepID=UPI00140E3D18|nr:S-layer homology domain-containing protein [Paenibacillus turpanensis]
MRKPIQTKMGLLLSSLLLTTLASPMGASASAVQFSDIKNSYAKDAVQSLVEKGIINGVGDGRFDPAGQIKRADFAIILAKTLDLDVTSAPAEATFSDVPSSHYSYKFVEAAAKAGLISGMGDGTFGAGSSLSRQDMAVLFTRALGADMEAAKGKQNLSFADAGAIADYAKDSVAYVVELGLISGNPGNSFNPQGNAERQQVALVASKFLGVKEAIGKAMITDAGAVNGTSFNVHFSKALEDLKATDMEVTVKATGESVDISTINPDASNKSYTVEAKLEPGTTYQVTYDERTVEFTTAPAEMTASFVDAETVKVAFQGIKPTGLLKDYAMKVKGTEERVAFTLLSLSPSTSTVTLRVAKLSPAKTYVISYKDSVMAEFVSDAGTTPVSIDVATPSSFVVHAGDSIALTLKVMNVYGQDISAGKAEQVEWSYPTDDGSSFDTAALKFTGMSGKTYKITAKYGELSDTVEVPFNSVSSGSSQEEVIVVEPPIDALPPVDEVAPTLTAVSVTGTTYSFSSNEVGKIYVTTDFGFIDPPAQVTQLQLEEHAFVKQEILSPNASFERVLDYGTFYAFAVDAAGNVSPWTRIQFID